MTRWRMKWSLWILLLGVLIIFIYHPLFANSVVTRNEMRPGWRGLPSMTERVHNTLQESPIGLVQQITYCWNNDEPLFIWQMLLAFQVVVMGCIALLFRRGGQW